MRLKALEAFGMNRGLDRMNPNELYNASTTEKVKTICALVKGELKLTNATEILKSLAQDNVKFWNTYLVSDFAIAALDIMGIRKYRGDKYEIKRLIPSGLKFN